MEHLNKIELKGTVGNVRLVGEGENQMVSFSVVTNFAYKSRTGDIIETTWHNVVGWAGKNNPDIMRIEKGSKAYVVGRLRNRSYVDKEGQERQINEVVASKVMLINSDEQFIAQM